MLILQHRPTPVACSICPPMGKPAEISARVRLNTRLAALDRCCSTELAHGRLEIPRASLL